MRKLKLSMKYQFIFLLILLNFEVFAQPIAKNWLTQNYDKAYDGGLAFGDLSNWQNNHKEMVTKAANDLPIEIKNQLIKKADEALNYMWPSLTASLYLDYKFTGTRTNFERLREERRKNLYQLVIGEVIQKKGRYIPQIVNGLWLTLEESTWVGPAHIVVQKEGAGLPAVNTKYIDLHASQTAANLAMIYNLLGADIAKYAVVVNSRLKQEIQERIFETYLNNNNFFWMGFNGKAVNNWNAFNNNNCMQAALLLLKPSDTLNRLSKKILNSLDYFINQYPTDGGCDEGPSYWDMAGGKLANLLINLQSASNGKISLIDQPKIHAMGTYAYKMQISGNKVVNFADAFANYSQNHNSVLAYGLLFNDEQLKNYASYIFNNLDDKFPIADVVEFAVSATNYQTLVKLKPVAPYPTSSLLPSLQVVTARERQGSDKGLFLAAKGGHNNESHNHNDVGNFIIYKDGLPILIDAGVGTYTAKTFSNKRYELWNVQSQWHNTPTINGYEQKSGSSYKASEFKHEINKAKETLSMDISKSYPNEAMVKSWKRMIELDRKKHQITLKEDFKLIKSMAQPELNFITAKKPVISNGKIHWTEGVLMSFDPKVFTAVIEEKKLDDERFINIWGSSIYRIKLISLTNQLIGTYQINFHSIN